jgi:hypothetical protein
MGISRSEIFRKKGKTRTQSVLYRCSLPKAMSISRSEIFRKKEEKKTRK